MAETPQSAALTELVVDATTEPYAQGKIVAALAAYQPDLVLVCCADVGWLGQGAYVASTETTQQQLVEMEPPSRLWLPLLSELGAANDTVACPTIALFSGTEQLGPHHLPRDGKTTTSTAGYSNAEAHEAKVTGFESILAQMYSFGASFTPASFASSELGEAHQFLHQPDSAVDSQTGEEKMAIDEICGRRERGNDEEQRGTKSNCRVEYLVRWRSGSSKSAAACASSWESEAHLTASGCGALLRRYESQAGGGGREA